MKNKSDMKKLTKKNFAAFVDIISNAYPGMKIITPEDKKKTIRRLTRAARDPKTNYYGLFKNGVLQGGMALYDFAMNYHGQMIPVGGVGLVAVDLLHKKEKVCKTLIEYFLHLYRKRGVSLTALYPFRPDFYKKMGFGYGAKISLYSVRPHDLPRSRNRLHIRYLTGRDKQSVIQCYNRFVKNTHGMMSERKHKWEYLFKTPEAKVIGYKEKNKVRGYMIFSFRTAQDGNWIKNNILVRELIYDSQEVLGELLGFLNTQSDQIHRILYGTHDEYLSFLLKDVRDGSDTILSPLAHQSNTQGIGIMYRIINTGALFTSLRLHNFNNQTCRLRVIIEDDFLPVNAGSIILHFRNGRVKTAARGYDVTIHMNIADFSSLVTGAVDFRHLWEYGLAKLSDNTFLDRVDDLFFTKQKPRTTTQF